MRCKPGDLAVIVESPEAPELVGRIARCVCLCPEYWLREPPHWDMDPPVRGNDGRLYGIADSSLRPLRDPGEDATDETLHWLPSPNKQTEDA